MTATPQFPQRERPMSAPSARTRVRWLSVLLAPVAFGVLTACGGKSAVDEQLRADLLAASQAPNARQFASPAELGYPAGSYPPGAVPYPVPYQGQYPQPYPQGYPQPYPPAAYPAPYPQPQPQVVYVPQRTSTVRTASTGSGASGQSRGTVVQEQRNTQKGAIIGAATGAAIGVATSRDRVKGGAIGALGGAVLGGVIGHQVKTPR